MRRESFFRLKEFPSRQRTSPRTRRLGRSWSPRPAAWPCPSSRSTTRWLSASTGAGSSAS